MNHLTVSHGLISFGKPIPSSRLSQPARSSRRQPNLTPSTTIVPSERLSVNNAVVGLVLNVARVQGEIKKHNITIANTRAPIFQLQEQLNKFKLSAELLPQCLESITTGSSQVSKRAALIDLDTLIASLTACVMTYSDLDDRFEDIVKQAEHNGRGITENYSPNSQILRQGLNRIKILDYQITELCNAMRLEDESEARDEFLSANESVTEMLQSDSFLSIRMAHLKDYFNVREQVPAARVAQIASRSPPGYSIPKPTNDRPPSYTDAMNDGNIDESVKIRPQNWSIFAGFTLDDIKCMDRIPLPLTCDEIKFGEVYATEHIQKCTRSRDTVKKSTQIGILRRLLRKPKQSSQK